MKTILIIGFSLTTQYNRKGYSDLLSKYDKIFFINSVKYFWRGFFLIQPSRIKGFLYKLAHRIYKKLKIFFGLIDRDNDADWINYKLLKKNPSFSKAELLRPTLKHKFDSIKSSYLLTKNILTLLNKDCFVVPIKGVDSAGYMIDSLQRHVPHFKIHKTNSFRVFISVWLYIYNCLTFLNWLEKFAKRNKIDSVVINHPVYMESGFVSCYLNKKFNTEIIHFSYRNKYPVSMAPRVKWFKKILDKEVLELLNTKKDIVNFKQNIYVEENGLFNLEDCSKKIIDASTIVIMMHAFNDANSLHAENSVIFSSYFQWIRSTLSIAKKNKDIKYIFRAHPSSYTIYKSDLQILDYFFKNNNEKNIQFEEPNQYSQLILKDKVPIFVSAKGNFSQEIAIAGIKCITLDESSAPNDCCKKINSKKEYIEWLSGKGDVNQLRLSETQRFKAKLNKKIFAELNSINE
mgnify:CR=1 FL=1|jgi:hypothetical protein